MLMRAPPTFEQTTLAVPTIYFGTEAEAKDAFKAFYDLGPLADTTALVPYPVLNTLMAPPIGLRSSMKGAAYTMPLRKEFVEEVLTNFIQFTDGNEDAKGSVVFYEMYDTMKIVKSDFGSFANRGAHLNGMIMPLWTKSENDQAFRKWARDINEMFKEELKRTGEEPGKGVEGGVGIRGKKGAVLLYGNYDRKSTTALCSCILTQSILEYDEKSRDIFGDNYSKLQKLKAQYDSTNVFNKLFAIAPQA